MSAASAGTGDEAALAATVAQIRQGCETLSSLLMRLEGVIDSLDARLSIAEAIGERIGGHEAVIISTIQDAQREFAEQRRRLEIVVVDGQAAFSSLVESSTA